jgi:hypothetical protein
MILSMKFFVCLFVSITNVADNTMAKRKSTKGQRSIKHTHKTKERVTRIALNPGVNLGAPEG